MFDTIFFRPCIITDYICLEHLRLCGIFPRYVHWLLLTTKDNEQHQFSKNMFSIIPVDWILPQWSKQYNKTNSGFWKHFGLISIFRIPFLQQNLLYLESFPKTSVNSPYFSAPLSICWFQAWLLPLSSLRLLRYPSISFLALHRAKPGSLLLDLF